MKRRYGNKSIVLAVVTSKFTTFGIDVMNFYELFVILDQKDF